MKSSSFLLDCRCLHKYCTKHILPESHNCIKIEEFRSIARQKNTEEIIENQIPKPKITFI